MKSVLFSTLFAALSVTLFTAPPAAAQNNNVGKRVERLEQEMRAVQRKIFPGGSAQYFEPDIAPEPVNPVGPSSTSSAVSDLIARVDTLESSLATLTGQVEQNGYRIKQLENKLAASPGNSETSIQAGNAGAKNNSADNSAKENDAKLLPDPERVNGVASIIMPDSGDKGEDAYIYGYRLWDAKYYPEAQAQLKKAAASHPTHRRASFAKNLLGRAYLDDGKPALAAIALYENYQELPRGERAPDSLYYLSIALVELNKKTEACQTLAELQEVYPDVANGRLSSKISRSKAAANCK
ncbi:hypothetical protein AB1K62_07175 [Parasphingorhabdus sp. JC815]|uniref:hypothetical protein n=1 Tax=Parasphingorhabdus sp. JC815 TaxID=3232140 RepID=UPI00345A1B01